MEHLDVLVVGAGLSGVAAGHYLQTECPWASYAIFEGRPSLGGTWDLFRFPGVRSDSDLYTFGYPFRPWTDQRAIADGASILRYISDTAAAEGIDAKIRFRHRVVAADWSTAEARWHVTAERTDTGDTVVLTCAFLFGCTGYYRYDHGYQPDFPGADRFAGRIVHPQAWPDDLDCTGRRVVVIGSGATAVTIVPALAPVAAHVTMVQRSPSYVLTVPTKTPIARIVRAVVPERWTGAALKWTFATMTQGFYKLSRRRPEMVRRMLRKGTAKQLPPGYDVDTHFNPRYGPWDERMCISPDGDLFRAIRSGQADVVTDHIDTFTERGIRLASGRELDADVIVTATGLELQFAGGAQLSVDGNTVDVASRLTYKGIMLEGVPNFALAFGYTNASWTLKADLTCRYVCRLLTRMRERGLRQCTPRQRDASVEAAPMLDLTSGYVRRGVDRLPKQGSASPWRITQSYFADYRLLQRQPLDDEVMEFSNPAPTVRAAAAAVGRLSGQPAGEATSTGMRRSVFS